jgi:hypothetical protein
MPDRILEPTELLAQGRLRHMQALGRLGEASRFDDRNEGSQKPWIEHPSPLWRITSHSEHR